MSTELTELNQSNIPTINVAVAVIYYQEQYLLGFRNQTQHQDNRYEFVGGKIDPDESATAALIREVSEETGIDISVNGSSNMVVKLGRLHHDYRDKQVCLHVYKVQLTAQQFTQYQHCRYGLEGQALTWVHKDQLLAGNYPLPAANQTILAWLQLPAQLVISYPLAHFSEQPNASEAWLNYHQQHLPRDAWVYVRTKAEHSAEIAAQLLELRPDIHSILPNDMASQILATNKQAGQPIKASHLTHTELLQWFDYSRDALKCSQQDYKYSCYLSSNRPLIISCHDADSITVANQLAAIRLEKKQSPVIGIFLSPVLATQTHPDDAPLGWEVWSSLAQLADMPVIALGGLSPSLGKQATQYGATSIAGIRQFYRIIS
ncbi:NUDIX domain-containing protein [Psychrobacter frigidicola]|uniref:NUDIX domain-containing protein n=1 Tax=Psychrobacter frigidicola TaxID=45611 RepID=UPI0019189951|nr:NUDIX domain-containing protein [Psychrobacter frigidicola]